MRCRILFLTCFSMLFSFNNKGFDGSLVKGSLPYFKALVKGDLKVVKCFVKAEGSEVTFENFDCDNRQVIYGSMPIHVAAMFGHLGIVKYLIEENNVDINVKSMVSEKTPLHCAAEEGKLNVVDYLVKAGAHIDQPCNEKGEATALQLACCTGQEEIVTYLVDAGANIHIGNRVDGETALLFAAKEGAEAVVKYLIEKGVDVNYEDAYTRSALYHACLKKLLDLVVYLVEHGAAIFGSVNVGKQDEEISRYLKQALLFDKAEDKASFLLDCINGKHGRIDEKHIKNIFFLRMIYCLCYKRVKKEGKKSIAGFSVSDIKYTVYFSAKPYCTFYMSLLQRAKRNGSLNSAVKKVLDIEEKYELNTENYYKALVKNLNTGKLPVKVEAKIEKGLICCKNQDLFKDALYDQLSAQTNARKIEGDVIISCVE